jgi:uncharacterized protein YcaQ
MTKPDLTALSDAATKAEQAIRTGGGGGAEKLVDAYLKAVGAYRTTLERLHRSGDLVLIEREGMRERVSKAIQDIMPQWLAEDGNVNDLDLADAAIAAILGEQP